MGFFWIVQFLGICFFIFFSIGSVTLMNSFIKEKHYKNFIKSSKMCFWLMMNIFIGIIIFNSFFNE